MMKKLLFFVLIFIMLFTSGCCKLIKEPTITPTITQAPEGPSYITLYGKLINKYTAKPVADAVVKTTSDPNVKAISQDDGNFVMKVPAKEARATSYLTLLISQKVDKTTKQEVDYFETLQFRINVGDADIIRIEKPIEVERKSRGKSYLYVSNYHSHNISVIEANIPTNTYTFLGNIPLLNGRGPKNMALDPERVILYVASSMDNAVTVIDTLSNKVIKYFQVGDKPQALAINKDGSLLFVGNSGENTVYVVDTETGKITNKIIVGRMPYHMVFDKDKKRLYVACALENMVYVIDSETKKVVARFEVKDFPKRIILSPLNDRIFVLCENSQDIAVLDAFNGRLYNRFQTGMKPHDIAYFAYMDEKPPLIARFYITNFEDKKITMIGGNDYSLIRSFDVGEGPFEILYLTDKNTLYVTSTGANDITVINTVTNMITNTIKLLRGDLKDDNQLLDKETKLPRRWDYPLEAKYPYSIVFVY